MADTLNILGTNGVVVVTGSPYNTTTDGTIVLSLNDELIGVGGLATNGFVQRTGTGTFIAAPISFTQVIDALGYTPGIASGAGSGTVTAVALDSADGALGFSGSPITTSGTITITLNEFTATTVGGVPPPGTPNNYYLRDDGTWQPPQAVSGGTVTSVAVSGASGISVTGSPITTSGTIGLSLGNITPTSVTATGNVTGANLSGTNTGDQTIVLSGDVSGTGTGAITTVLATVNSNVGSFGGASKTLTVTANGKGLITAVAETNIAIAASQITSGTLAGTLMPAYSGDASSSAGATVLTLATVNSNVGSFGSASKTVAITVNGKGLTTAAAEQDINIAGSQVGSGTVSGARLPAWTASGDATGTYNQANPGNIPLTFATVNSNVGTFASVTVNGKGLVTAATALSGDATTSGAVLTLATVNASAGTKGSSTQVPVFVVNGKGLVTSVTNTSIAFPVTSVFGRTGAVVAQTGDYTFSQVSGTLDVTTQVTGVLPIANGGTAQSSVLPAFTQGTTVTPGIFTSNNIQNYVNSRFVLFNYSAGVSATSTDGASWTVGTAISGYSYPTNSVLSNISHNGTVYCMLDTGTNTNSYTSTNGTGWTKNTLVVTEGGSPVTVNTIGSSTSVVAVSGTFYALFGTSGTGGLFSSTDGITWVRVNTGPTSVGVDLFSNGATLFAYNSTGVNVSYSASPFTSWVNTTTTGLTGTPNLPPTIRFNASIGGGTWCATNWGGADTNIFTSTNGVAWTAHTVTLASRSMRIIHCGAKGFIIPNSGTAGIFDYTPDGTTFYRIYGTPGTAVSKGVSNTANTVLFYNSSTTTLLTFTLGDVYTANTAIASPIGNAVASTKWVENFVSTQLGGGGTVTSVAATVPSFLSVSGSPITTSGTLAITLATQTANTIFAGPTTGSAAAPTFRAMVAADVPTLNQNTTGSAATLTTSRNINSVAFNGSADITVTAAAGTLTGTTLNATVVSSSLTSVGTIATGVWNGTAVGPTYGGTGQTSYTTGDILYASATNTLSKLAAGTDTYVLTMASGVPTWAAPTGGGGTPGGSTTQIQYNSSGSFAGSANFTFDPTGGPSSQPKMTLGSSTDGILYIGTNGSIQMTAVSLTVSAAGAREVAISGRGILLSETSASNQLRFSTFGGVGLGTSGNTYGSAGQVLTSGGGASPMVWSTPTTGTVTSVATGTGLTGGAITTTGTISLSSGSIASLLLADSAVQPGDLATVATTGDYDDLINTPAIPDSLLEDVLFATASQTVFTLTNVTATSKFPTGTNAYVVVYVNGVRQREDNSTADAYATAGSFYVSDTDEITFFTGLASGDEVIVNGLG